METIVLTVKPVRFLNDGKTYKRFKIFFVYNKSKFVFFFFF